MKLLNKLKNKDHLLMLIILILGILVRVIGITLIPNALNCDEASAGYEAYSILNFGIDRNNNFIPAFLVSWGSGQNALYTYLMIPFIKVLGLNTLSLRLPMVIISSISLIIMYKLLKKISNKKIALLGLFFLSICPWHIMKSRWGLESNLFPDIMLLFIYILITSLENKNKFLYYLSFVIAGLSAYSYGTSYFFLPIFLIPLLIILIRKKVIKLKDAILGILIVGIVSMPIILYVLINTFNFDQINLPFLTIPRLNVNRYEEITSIFSHEFFNKSFKNISSVLSIIFTQNDHLPWNSLKYFGTIYLFSLPFTIIGLINSFKRKKYLDLKYDYIFIIWFIVSLILSLIVIPNINRINIIFIPIIYFTIIGIFIVLDKLHNKKITISLISLYIVSFLLFIISYCHEDFNEYSTFEGNLEPVMDYVSQIDKDIFITNKIRVPYIYVLYYTKYNTQDFVNTVKYKDQFVEFRVVESFEKYHFEDILNIDENNVYVIKTEDQKNYNLDNYKISKFKDYLVIES